MNCLKKNIVSLIMGVVIGVPISLYGVNHQSGSTIPKPETNIYIVETPKINNDNPMIEVEVGKIQEPEFIYIPLIDLDEETQRMVFEISEENGISYTLILAIIEHESGCQPNLYSKTHDSGYMQINDVNKDDLKIALGVTDLMNPEENIKSGCYILKNLFDKYEEVDKVLMCYHFGERGAVSLWNEGKTESVYSNEIINREIEFSQYIDNERGI